MVCLTMSIASMVAGGEVRSRNLVPRLLLTPAQTLKGPTNVTFSNIISDGRKFVFRKSRRRPLSLSTSADQHEVISPECAALIVPLTSTAVPRVLKYK
jgi:hypothetical protein